MTLWELAKKILYRDSSYRDRFGGVHPNNKATFELRFQGYKGFYERARDNLFHFELRRGISNNGAYTQLGPHWDLFQDEDAFWSDYHDHEFGFGRAYQCGTQHTIAGSGELIIHTGWYRWFDGSIRSSIEKP